MRAPAATKWIYDFDEGSRELRDLLGGKGSGIAEMAHGADLDPTTDHYGSPSSSTQTRSNIARSRRRPSTRPSKRGSISTSRLPPAKTTT